MPATAPRRFEPRWRKLAVTDVSRKSFTASPEGTAVWAKLGCDDGPTSLASGTTPMATHLARHDLIGRFNDEGWPLQMC
jgi:hypothetical protein